MSTIRTITTRADTIANLETAIREAAGAWSGVEWTTDHNVVVETWDRDGASLTTRLSYNADGTHVVPDEDEVYVQIMARIDDPPKWADDLDLRHYERVCEAARDLAESVVAYCADVIADADAAAAHAEDAADALAHGDIEGAIEEMEEAAELEGRWDIDPTYGPLLRQLQALQDEDEED